VAFAFILLTGATLLLTSFRELLKVNPGFSTQGVLIASISAPQTKYPEPVHLRSLMNRSLEAIRRIPGVTSAGATTGPPFAENYSDSVILAENYVMRPGESVISPLQLRVTPGYFETMGISLVRGRYFDERDSETAPPSVIVDERLARKFWPDKDPIGRRMYQPNWPDGMTPDERTRWLIVVGVVRSVRLQNLAGTGNTTGAYYFPYAQTTPRSYSFAVKTDAPDAGQALRRVIAGIDPTLAIFDVSTIRQRTELSLLSRKTAMQLALFFAGVAVLLSAVGVYGVLAYLVSQRRREIGIRLAVGSSQRAILGLVLRNGLVLSGNGVVLGLLGASLLQTIIEKHIYGVHPLDPVILVIAIVLMVAIALTASVWPARKAAKTDAITVLNEV
jgi:predicted permease